MVAKKYSERIDPARSWLMSRVRGKDTVPEIQVRRLVHGMGYRFRLHQRALPGTPDLVFPRYRKVMFVHGCFWHRHAGCKFASTPKTRRSFWTKKFADNMARDRKKTRLLRKLGWEVMVIWSCQTRDEKLVEKAVKNFLDT